MFFEIIQKGMLHTVGIVICIDNAMAVRACLISNIQAKKGPD